MAEQANGETKKAALNGLAIVGFGALIIAGIFLAIYAARYVPETLSRLSSAVILSSGEEQNPEEEAPVAEAEEEPAPEEEEEPSTGGPQVVTPPVPVSPNPPVYYPPQPQLYGKADLALSNVRIGYFRGSTFIEDNEVPDGRDMGIKFVVRNSGTNIAPSAQIRVEVEGERDAIGTLVSLNPNGTQSFTVRVTNPEEGNNREVSIDVDYRNAVDESNESNNDRTVRIDVEND